MKKPLKLRLAIHPGCHMFRETEGGDIWRKPKQFEEIVRATGADVVKNKLDRLCCGFPVMQVNERICAQAKSVAQVDGVYKSRGSKELSYPAQPVTSSSKLVKSCFESMGRDTTFHVYTS